MILDGKKLASEILSSLVVKGNPTLAFILVGDNPDSKTYVNVKKRACESIGITSLVLHLKTEEEVLEKIDELNRDPSVKGILVQQPLPFDVTKIVLAIDPNKDVDGFHPINMGKLLIGDPSGKVPCTPLGVIKLLEHAHIDPAGKEVVIVGRSNIVGKPLAALMLQKNATVTVCHSHTKNLAEVTRRADILCVAIGKPRFITEEMVKEGAVVIDIGITDLVGDVDFEKVAPKCSYITPVPGGVGPMTVAMLLTNTLLSS